jgi:phosphoglycolate phosphatase-like HAD superfamily hydrolase
MRSISLLITDLDNTLFDWVATWHASFSALLNGVSEISGIPTSVLIPEIRRVHQQHGTAEYAFLLEEIPSLRSRYPASDMQVVFAKAIEAFRHARKATLALYPGVFDTLSTIRAAGCMVVGYTESMAFYTNYRLRKLDLDLLLDFLYSPADHQLPEGQTPEMIRRYPPEQYTLRHTKQINTPKGELKPNPTLLLDIINGVQGRRDQVIYIGDSLMKDISMAQRACVCDVWAKYGTAQSRPEYSLLREVTHWSDEQVERERKLTASQVQPTFTLEGSFSDILDLFEFVPFNKASDPVNK